MFIVFDCSKAFGVTFKTRFEFLAREASLILSGFTGRMYDYERVTAFHFEP